MINGLLLWLNLLLGFYVAYALGARTGIARPTATAAAAAEAPPAIPSEKMVAMESRLAPMLIITGRKVAGDVFQFEGRLRGKAEDAFRKIHEAFAGEPVTPLLLPDLEIWLEKTTVERQITRREFGYGNQVERKE